MNKIGSALNLLVVLAVIHAAAGDVLDVAIAAAEAEVAAAEAAATADVALADFKAAVAAQTTADAVAEATDAIALSAISDASATAAADAVIDAVAADAAVVDAQNALDDANAGDDAAAVVAAVANLALAQTEADSAATAVITTAATAETNLAATVAAEQDDAAAVAAASAVAVAAASSEVAAIAAAAAAVTAAEASATATAAYEAIIARDAYELDNSRESAGVIIVNNETPQGRTFHEQGDEDWVRFIVHEREFYTILVDQVGLTTDPVLSVYGFDAQGDAALVIDSGGDGDAEVYAFQAESDGIFLINLSNYDVDEFGLDVTYSLSVTVENLSGNFAGPDLQLVQSSIYVKINQGTAIILEVDVTNFGGQLADNTARNLSLNTYLASGMSLLGELPDGCSFDNLAIACNLTDLDAQQSSSFNFMVRADSLGRRSIVSAVASYFDSERTMLQWDDRLSNNTSGTDFTIIERINFGLNVRTGKTSYLLGENFDFYLKLDTNNEDLSLGSVDVYFSVEIPGGSIIYIVDLLPVTSAESIPLLRNWQPFSVPDTHLLGFPLPEQIPSGDYTWSIILVRTGGNVNQQADRLSSMSFAHTVRIQ